MSKPADRMHVERVMAVLLSSYPHQAHDPDTMLEQLVRLGTGYPEDVIDALVIGVLSTDKNLVPSIAVVKKWLDQNNHSIVASEHRLLPPEQDMKLSPAEREYRIKTLEKLSGVFKQTGKALTDTKRSRNR